MPNHVTNAIEFASQNEFELAIRKLVNNEGNVDFELLVPTPNNVYHGNTSQEDKQDFGQLNWYDWNQANWGTKWNAYESEVDSALRIIRFDTAWLPPYPIIVALSRHVPDFTHYHIEEVAESWSKQVWKEGTRVDYWKNDPSMYEDIFEIVHGTGTYEQYAEEQAADGNEWPPVYVQDNTPIIKLSSRFMDEKRRV